MEYLTDTTTTFFKEMLKKSKNPNEIECLSKAINQFLENGEKESAFIVYYCFCEIFHVFGGGYKNVQKLIEVLSAHEYHAGGLLMKHKDHYSHSVYVFTLGLSIFIANKSLREEFFKFYKIDNNDYERFLFLWGMTSLFHDIGYPFQLAHEQIKTYVNDLWEKSVCPYVSYGNMDALITIADDDALFLQKELHAEQKIDTINKLLAIGINKRVGYDEEKVTELLRSRIEKQPDFLDHGYFSAVLLAKSLLQNLYGSTDNSQSYFVSMVEKLDVLTAILLHNSFNKFEKSLNLHKITLTEHPLAFLLALCDELQIWDRTAFGKMSKKDPLAWTVQVEINDKRIDVTYYFDSFIVKAPQCEDRVNKSKFEIESGQFVEKIKNIIDTDIELNAFAKQRKKEKRTNLYVSQNNFINLYDFAKAVHLSYLENCQNLNIMHINEEFEALPLEFKISNIEQAKSYSKKLELINCFYSDKELDYPVVNDFKEENTYGKNTDNLGFLCREEHVRWVKEKLKMGWHYGTSYTEIADHKEQFAMRNKLKEHKDIVPYEMLMPAEQKKDEIMIKNIIPLLYNLGNNIRIYRYRWGRKPDLEIAGIGHRNIKGNTEEIKAQIKAILSEYQKDYHIIVRSCFATGADQLISECATELDITIKAVLPMELEEYIKMIYLDAEKNKYPFTLKEEMHMRHLIAQTVVCKIVKGEDEDYKYLDASKYIINKCQKVIAIWDGIETLLQDHDGKLINQGGTYHCIEMARLRGLTDKDIHIIKCKR